MVTEWIMAIGAVLVPVIISGLSGIFLVRAGFVIPHEAWLRSMEAHNRVASVIPGLLGQKKKKTSGPAADWLVIGLSTIPGIFLLIWILPLVPDDPGGGIIMLVIVGLLLSLQIASWLVKQFRPQYAIRYSFNRFTMLSCLLILSLAGYFYGLHHIVTQASLDTGPLNTVNDFFNSELLTLLLFLFGCFVGPITLALSNSYFISRLLSNCNYDRALWYLNLVNGVAPGFSLSMRSRIMTDTGQLDEAKVLISKRLTLLNATESAETYASELSVLGCVRSRQGHYAEAEDIFNTVLEINPDNHTAEVYLAEIYLEQGHGATRALELLNGFITKQNQLLGNPNWWGSVYGNKAWALALLGELVASEAAIDEGFAHVNSKYKPGLASLHWRAGRALLLSGKADRAHAHFRTALLIDPKGVSGRLTAAELNGN